MRCFRLLIFLIAAFVSTIATSPMSAAGAKGEAEIKPTKSGDPNELTMTVAKFRSDGKSLGMTLTASGDVVGYLKSNMADRVVTLAIDTDNDAATGGKPFGAKQGGFEVKADVFICKEFDGGSVCAGDVPGKNISGHRSEIEPQLWFAARKRYKSVHPLSWKGGRGRIDGAKIDVALSYADIGVKPGDTVRIKLLTGFKGGRFDDLTLILN